LLSNSQMKVVLTFYSAGEYLLLNAELKQLATYMFGMEGLSESNALRVITSHMRHNTVAGLQATVSGNTQHDTFNNVFLF
jgi:hypothetical protein